MLTAIEPLVFHSALLYGAQKVEKNREELNRINGFPVPDRDTGNNLAYLMQQLRRQLPPSGDFSDLLIKLSEAALVSARGNSGAIFSQYFSGFREGAAELKASIPDALPLPDLAQMFRAGYLSAYRSIQQPREGTILSAMRSFGDAFHQLLAQGADLKNAAEAALSRLKATVQESINVLPQQRALHAPDAGAMAFLYFAEGFMNSLLGRADDQEDIERSVLYEPPAIDETEHQIDGETRFRYCTEALLRLHKDAPISQEMKASLTALGDSMVVSRVGTLARVHLHTNSPAQAVDLLETLGTLTEIKADDMLMQQALAQPHSGKTALVIDSIADVPEDMLGKDVYVLPLHLMAGGVSYQDKRTISPDRMRKLSGKLSSSQLNLEEIRIFLDPIVKSYDEVLILTVSSKMSGLHARYSEYLKLHPDTKLHLVDSLVNSGAEGLLALHAAQRLKDGASAKEVAAETESLRERTKILVSLPNLKAMVASGRLNKRIGWVLIKTGFLPLVTIDPHGEGTITGLSFSRKRSDRLLLEKLRPGNIERYAVVHANDFPRAEKAARDISAKIGMEPAYICDISSVVTNFAGESSYAVAYIERILSGGKPA
ncbi:MAG: DegV family protein [Eubacteriales bacterium]|nr:DegV family protein [Eubacteriales bacterium]